MRNCFNLFTVLKKLKECVGFFFFKFLIGYNGSRLGEVGDFENETLKLLLNLN